MKNKITLLIVFLTSNLFLAQNIEFTFANTQMTNDGSFDYYETDIMIAAIDGLADFKLGAGLLYINYNTAAFGSNIVGSGSVAITYPNPDYILGDMNALPYYSSFLPADNTSSRLAFSYQQGLSSGGMLANNVTSTPKKLFHLKIEFVDSGMDPMVVFEDNETQPPGVNDCRDQFFTACGPSSFAIADCGSNPGTQFQDAIFNSAGAVLSVDNKFLTGISVYPNPTTERLFISSGQGQELKMASLYDITGKVVLTKTFQSSNNDKELNLSSLPTGLYILRLESDTASITKKVIKK